MAGVSFQTASKVLNGGGSVSATTRRRILDAARALDYVPNALARGLLSGSTRTVGVIASDFTDAALARGIVGIDREARRHGWSLLIGSLDRTGSDLGHSLRVLVERQVDGIILDTPATETTPHLRDVVPSNLSVVSLHPVHGGGIARVGVDNLAAGLLAVRHLLALGRRQIGLVTGTPSRWAARERTRAYRLALEEAAIAYDPQLVEPGGWTVEGGYAATHRLLDRAPSLSAIYAQGDAMAVGVLAALHDRGRRIPEDCAVVGCDDLAFASRTVPSLTTVRIPFYEGGEVAMRMLLEQSEGKVSPPETLLPVEMIYRASSASVGSATP